MHKENSEKSLFGVKLIRDLRKGTSKKESILGQNIKGFAQRISKKQLFGVKLLKDLHKVISKKN